MDSMDFVGNMHICCEYCGTEYDHATHHVVERHKSEALALDIINDEFFYAVCPHCHRMTGVDHLVVYTDMEKKALIAYFDSDIELSLAETQIGEWMQEFGVDSSYNTVRIVSTQNELREKIILLNNDLDDRVIEILKLMALDRVREEGHNQKFEEARCSVLKDGRLNVDFVGDEPMHIATPRWYYDKMEKAMRKALNASPTPLVVSTEWAVEFDVTNRL
jgi:hypothetical protein